MRTQVHSPTAKRSGAQVVVGYGGDLNMGEHSWFLRSLTSLLTTNRGSVLASWSKPTLTLTHGLYISCEQFEDLFYKGHTVSRASDSKVGPQSISCCRSGKNRSISCIVPMVWNISQWILSQRKINMLVSSFFIAFVVKCFSDTPYDSEPGEK